MRWTIRFIRRKGVMFIWMNECTLGATISTEESRERCHFCKAYEEISVWFGNRASYTH